MDYHLLVAVIPEYFLVKFAMKARTRKEKERARGGQEEATNKRKPKLGSLS